MFRNLAPHAALALSMLPALRSARGSKQRDGLERRGLPRPPDDPDEEEEVIVTPPIERCDDDSDADPWAPEVAATLLALGYPPALDRTRQPRAPDAPHIAARRFLTFLLDTSDETALKRLPTERVIRLYREFCRLDHRKPCFPNYVVGALKDMPGVLKFEVPAKARQSSTATFWEFMRVDAPKDAPLPLVNVGGRPKGKSVLRRRRALERKSRQRGNGKPVLSRVA